MREATMFRVISFAASSKEANQFAGLADNCHCAIVIEQHSLSPSRSQERTATSSPLARLPACRLRQRSPEFFPDLKREDSSNRRSCHRKLAKRCNGEFHRQTG
jgi:hypothetical protein